MQRHCLQSVTFLSLVSILSLNNVTSTKWIHWILLKSPNMETFCSQILWARSKINVTLVVAVTNLQRSPPLFLSWVGAFRSPLQTQLCCVKSVMKKQTRHLLDNFTDCCHDLPSAAVDCEMVLMTLLVAWFCVFHTARTSSVIGLMRAQLQPCCCFNKTAIAFSLCLLSLSHHLSLCSYLPFRFFRACCLAGCCMTHGTLIQCERHFFFSRTRTLIVSIIKPGRDTSSASSPPLTPLPSLFLHCFLLLRQSRQRWI